jgi:hypothetical protein
MSHLNSVFFKTWFQIQTLIILYNHIVYDHTLNYKSIKTQSIYAIVN